MKIKYQLIIILLLIADFGYSQKKIKLCSSESIHYHKSSTSLSCNTSQSTFSTTGNCDNLCGFLCESFSIPVVITLINNSNNDLNVTISHANSTFSQAKVPFLQGTIDLQLTADFGQNPRIILDNTLYNNITNANSSAQVMDELRLSPYYQDGYLNIFITEHNNSPSAYIGSNDVGYQLVQVPASQINITTSDFHIETFIHEIGHNLGLLHTFDGYFNGNGQPQCTQDGIGDTNFDPYDGVNQTIVGGNITNCQWQNTTNVIYDPPIDNYMSYYYGDLSTNCQFSFTDCQISKMQNIVEQCKVPIWGGLETVDLSNGLVAYYPFNGNANDESGNGNDCQVVNTTLDSDRFGNTNSAYYFDGIDDFITITDDVASFGIVDDNHHTLSMWIKPITLANNPNTMIITDYDQYGTSNTNGGCCDDNFDFAIGIRPNWNYRYGIRRQNNTIDEITNEPAEMDKWHHLVQTKDQDSIYFYVNNQFIRSTKIPNFNYPGTARLTLGTFALDWEVPPYYNGLMDDIRIYDRVLNCSELDLLYSEGCIPINLVQNEIIDIDTTIYALEMIELDNVTVISPYDLILKAPEVLIENNCQVNQGAKLEVINEEGCFEN